MITTNQIDYFEEADAKIIAYKLQYLVDPDVTPLKEHLKIISSVEISSIKAVSAYDLYHTSDWDTHYKNFPKPYKGVDTGRLFLPHTVFYFHPYSG